MKWAVSVQCEVTGMGPYFLSRPCNPPYAFRLRGTDVEFPLTDDARSIRWFRSEGDAVWFLELAGAWLEGKIIMRVMNEEGVSLHFITKQIR